MHRFEEQAAVETLSPEAIGYNRLLDDRVPLDNGRLITAVPGDMGGGIFLCQGPEGVERRAAADHQRRAGLGERCRELLERVMEPPPRGRIGLPGSLLFGRPDKDRHDPATGRGRSEGWIVVEAQIVAKPDKRDGFGHEASS